VSEGYAVRRLTPSDVARYVELRREMLLDTPVAFLGDPSDDECLDPAVMSARLAGEESAVFCAVDGADALCAVAGLYRETRAKMRHRCTIWGVYTRPGHRRRGLSRAVLEAAIQHGERLDGVEILQLSVSVEAPGARRLYESLGFTAWGREPRAVRVGERQVDEVHMWRPAGGR